MADLESTIDTLRTLDVLRVNSARLRDEGKDALIALLEQDPKPGSLLVSDITDRPSLIDKLQHDATPATQAVSTFIWGQVPQATRDLLNDSTLPLPQRQIALIQELNRLLQGTSLYESVPFTRVSLRPETRSLKEQHPVGDRLLWLNRLLLEDAYPLEILRRTHTLDIFSDVPYISIALWELPTFPPEHLTDLRRALQTVTLQEIAASPLSILRAADVMQGIIAAPGFIFAQSLPHCYYLLIRELYTADAPDWRVGGARAHFSKGTVSAFMTRKCVRALLSLARALENTCTFIAQMGALQQRVKHLRGMQAAFTELQEWVAVEEARLRLALRTTIRTSSRLLVLQPPELTDSPFITIDKYIDNVASQLKETAKNVRHTFKRALNDIRSFHKIEKSQSTGNDDDLARFQRAAAGHVVATSALKRGKNNAAHIVNDILVGDWRKDVKKWKELEEEVKKVASQIRKLLHPVKNFLSSVLDHQLAAAAGGNYGEWDAVEITCAAASYCAVTNEWDDDRLSRVVDSLNKLSSDRGRFPIGRPFHVDVGEGNYHLPDNTAVIEALAYILKKTAEHALHLRRPCTIPVEPALVEKLLRFFGDTRADKPVRMTNEGRPEDRDKKGWRFDYTPLPSQTEPPATAATVQSLALINRMLDEQINARILYYFAVQQPDKIETDLNTLFYPDYGMRQLRHEDLTRESVAVSLQKMRAHVTGLRDLDTLYSIVLHGPQGTGKTTLAEALASTCEVPLVEVTPSDIVVGGGEAVERRARIVFEALSLLTRVVILFDEFDPVVWKREPTGGRPSDVFSFLTASMLPKLKTLHKTAKIRSVAYILITNLIGTLDEATIRKGRFDETVGIYPPDVLSRAGHFVNEAAVVMEKDPSIVLPPVDELKARLDHLLKMSCGAGMQDLNRPDTKARFLDYYIRGDHGVPDQKPKALDPDARWADQKIKGRGRFEVREYRQWGWIDRWDKKLEKKGLEALNAPPTEAPAGLPPSFWPLPPYSP